MVNNNLSLKKPGTLEKVRKLAASNPQTIYDLWETIVNRLKIDDCTEKIIILMLKILVLLL
jgi:hypothetical protein